MTQVTLISSNEFSGVDFAARGPILARRLLWLWGFHSVCSLALICDCACAVCDVNLAPGTLKLHIITMTNLFISHEISLWSNTNAAISKWIKPLTKPSPPLNKAYRHNLTYSSKKARLCAFCCLFPAFIFPFICLSCVNIQKRGWLVRFGCLNLRKSTVLWDFQTLHQLWTCM